MERDGRGVLDVPRMRVWYVHWYAYMRIAVGGKGGGAGEGVEGRNMRMDTHTHTHTHASHFAPLFFTATHLTTRSFHLARTALLLAGK